MACGTPVVCGDIPDYDAKYFEHGKTVLMANVDDAGSVAQAIVTVLKQDELAANLAAEARARVVELGSYESQMSRVEQLYQGLMQ
jgi:glycosyltransferase involved in cell wall biosynthesis